MFASRLPSRLTPNAVSQAVADARASDLLLLDLTETNPTAVGLSYPSDILSSLGDARSTIYRPDPRGLFSTREAIARDSATYGRAVSADTMVLTSSTSEGYAWLFKLLCDPGDAVLVPQPSYPLFDLLTSLEGVRATPYHLSAHDAWSIDRASVLRALDTRTRAVLVVSPNNPTGSMLTAGDREWLVALAAERRLAIIADEVFGAYPIAPRAGACSLTGETRALTFVLDGMSKSIGLPQVKLGWMTVSGPDADVHDALHRLEIVADTYLSVSTPVQIAAPQLLEAGRPIRAAIGKRVTRNLAALRETVAAQPALTLVEPEGGWSAAVRVPELQSEDALIVHLLRHAQVLAHPGYFFDFADGHYLVVSLLPDPVVFDRAIARLAPIAAAGIDS